MIWKLVLDRGDHGMIGGQLCMDTCSFISWHLGSVTEPTGCDKDHSPRVVEVEVSTSFY